MTDGNSDWEEKPRINDLWNLSDIPLASISTWAAGPATSQWGNSHHVSWEPGGEILLYSRTGRGRLCPLHGKIKVDQLGNAEAGRGDEKRAAVKWKSSSWGWEWNSTWNSHISSPSAVPTPDFPCRQGSGRPVYKCRIRDAAWSKDILFGFGWILQADCTHLRCVLCLLRKNAWGSGACLPLTPSHPLWLQVQSWAMLNKERNLLFLPAFSL